MSRTRFIVHSVKQTLLDNNLLHRRGCRGESRKRMPILTISVLNVVPRKREPRVQDQNCRCLTTIRLEHPAADVAAAGSDGFAEAPALYILNANSIAKPHAIEQLSMEVG